MPDMKKYDLILDSLQQLLEEKEIQYISVSEIAKRAGMGKGSIYYYFPSKNAILEALIERSYEEPLNTAKNLASKSDVPPFTRMAMLFQACRTSSSAFIKHNQNTDNSNSSAEAQAFLHQKYLSHLISELKPDLTEIIKQGISSGDIHFAYPEALAEIVLIVIAVKLDNSLVQSTPQETENTLKGLISLLERGTGVPSGTLSYLSLF